MSKEKRTVSRETAVARAFSHREKVPEGRMRDLQCVKIPHPIFDHPLPAGEGPREKVSQIFESA
jgi:hypothetical protein